MLRAHGLRVNPLRIVADSALLPYWADLHGQSEETIGTNSARELIEFARDRAFLDAMSHQATTSRSRRRSGKS